MRENVILKGNRSGIQLLFDDVASFPEMLIQLENKLKAATNFFHKGTIFSVPSKQRTLTDEEKESLTDLLAKFGMTWVEMESLDIKQELTSTQSAETLVVAKTVRNGQVIEHPGSIIIVGDVNPGAIIIAGGDISIVGTCRGVVQAGCYGNINATITAQKLMAAQLRIAHFISRAPDDLEEPNCEEIAQIKEGIIVIEPTHIDDEGDKVNG